MTASGSASREGIDGVVVHEVLHVPRDHGVITEVFRPEWDPTGLPVVHLYQSRLFPGAIGAWSCHMESIDRLFVNQGISKLVLFDGREQSRTNGQLMELHVGDARPAFLVIPAGGLARTAEPRLGRCADAEPADPRLRLRRSRPLSAAVGFAGDSLHVGAEGRRRTAARSHATLITP